MNKKNFLTFTGMWLYLVLAGTLWICLWQLENLLPLDLDFSMRLVIIFALPAFIPAIITISNLRRLHNGHEDFGVKDAVGRGKTNIETKELHTAMYPDIPRQYLTDRPRGFILGTYKNKYVFCPIGSDGNKNKSMDGINVTIIGTPGSGKTVLLLSWLMTNLYGDEIDGK